MSDRCSRYGSPNMQHSTDFLDGYHPGFNMNSDLLLPMWEPRLRKGRLLALGHTAFVQHWDLSAPQATQQPLAPAAALGSHAEPAGFGHGTCVSLRPGSFPHTASHIAPDSTGLIKAAHHEAWIKADTSLLVTENCRTDSPISHSSSTEAKGGHLFRFIYARPFVNILAQASLAYSRQDVRDQC